MKVWILEDFSHGETEVYAEDTDVLEIPYVKEELSYLVGGYDDELEEFKADIANAVKRGRGSAAVEERFSITLEEVK